MIDLIKIIHIHPLFWAILGIGALTGLFKEIIMLFIIVFVHELGHSYMAYRFQWRIKQITLLPFGGMAEMDEYGNKSIREEVLVILAGPLQHLWLIGASYLLLLTPFWTEGDHQIFLFHNMSILLFNLLPILPLDGGRLLFSFISFFYPFYQAYHLNYYLSITFLMIASSIALFILPFHLNLIAVLMFIWLQHYLDWKQRHYVFLRFLMERMVRGVAIRGQERMIKLSSSVPVTIAIKKINRQAYHYFSLPETNQFIEEGLVLEAFFDEKKRLLPIGKLI